MAQSFADGVVTLARRHHQQESAAARAQQLSTLRAGLAGRFIPAIDALVTNTESQRAFELPSFVQKFPEFIEIAAAGKCLPHRVGEVAHLAKDRHLVGCLGTLLLE